MSGIEHDISRGDAINQAVDDDDREKVKPSGCMVHYVSNGDMESDGDGHCEQLAASGNV